MGGLHSRLHNSSSSNPKGYDDVGKDVLTCFDEVSRLRLAAFTSYLQGPSTTKHPFPTKHVLSSSSRVYHHVFDTVSGPDDLVQAVKDTLGPYAGSTALVEGISGLTKVTLHTLLVDPASAPVKVAEKTFLTVGSVGGVYRVDVQFIICKFTSTTLQTNLRDVVSVVVVVTTPDVAGMAQKDVLDHVHRVHGDAEVAQQQQIYRDLWNGACSGV